MATAQKMSATGAQTGLLSAQTGVAIAGAGGAVALPQDLMAELAGHAKEASAKEQPTVGRISLRNGQMSYGDAYIPGNSMDCVIVGGAYRNVWYAGTYDPDNIVNPSCFALADEKEGMAPHENVSEPVCDTCEGCPKAQWGSAPPRGGKPSRGKACKETRRIIILPSDCLESVEAVKAAKFAIIDLPVTSVGNYATLISALDASLNMPVWAVVTNVKLSPHPRNQFEVGFTPLRVAGDEPIIRALMARREEAMKIALVPYEGTGGENDPDAGKEQAPTKTAKKIS